MPEHYLSIVQNRHIPGARSIAIRYYDLSVVKVRIINQGSGSDSVSADLLATGSPLKPAGIEIDNSNVFI
jgi:hypothetical protein